MIKMLNNSTFLVMQKYNTTTINGYLIDNKQ